MAKKSTIARIYDDLVTACKTVVESKYIFTGGRPNNIMTDSDVAKFIVIDLPVSIEDIAFGNKKFVLDTTGVIYLFVKSKKDSTLNINATSDFIEEVFNLFPVRGAVCGAANPKVLTRGADEYGYQVVTVTFDLQTKANVFNNNV